MTDIRQPDDREAEANLERHKRQRDLEAWANQYAIERAHGGSAQITPVAPQPKRSTDA